MLELFLTNITTQRIYISRIVEIKGLHIGKCIQPDCLNNLIRITYYL
jgi:hypothetical protein